MKTINFKKLGFLICIFSAFLSLSETAYFGGHFSAKSDAEMICDCLIALPMIFGVALFLSSTK